MSCEFSSDLIFISTDVHPFPKAFSQALEKHLILKRFLLSLKSFFPLISKKTDQVSNFLIEMLHVVFLKMEINLKNAAFYDQIPHFYRDVSEGRTRENVDSLWLLNLWVLLILEW